MKYKSTSTKASRLACTATCYKDRWIGAFSIGLTILGNSWLSKQEEDDDMTKLDIEIYEPKLDVYGS